MTLHVKAVAYTMVDFPALEETGYILHHNTIPQPDDDAPEEEWVAYFDGFGEVSEIDELHEAAGRGCYESWHRPNPATATNKTYLGHIIEVDHLSVVGHGHVTLYVKGVSRALLLELERHQQRYSINFSVLSQRYVNHGMDSDIGVVIPPHFNEDQAAWLQAFFESAQARYDKTYKELRDEGKDVKEARGAARAFLPENTETRFFVTGSIRAWRNIIEQRATDAADIEIRLFALEVLKELVRLCPNSVQDLAEIHGIGDN